MKKKIRIITNPEEIKRRLEKLYDKIDLQVLLYEANISQKKKIFSKKEINKVTKYNLECTTSIS